MYSLSGPLQTRFVDPCSRRTWPRTSIHSLQYWAPIRVLAARKDKLCQKREEKAYLWGLFSNKTSIASAFCSNPFPVSSVLSLLPACLSTLWLLFWWLHLHSGSGKSCPPVTCSSLLLCSPFPASSMDRPAFQLGATEPGSVLAEGQGEAPKTKGNFVQCAPVCVFPGWALLWWQWAHVRQSDIKLHHFLITLKRALKKKFSPQRWVAFAFLWAGFNDPVACLKAIYLDDR